MDVIIEYQFAISFIISLASSAFFIGWQYKVYLKNIAAIDVFKLFFSKKENYNTFSVISYEGSETGKSISNTIIKDVADSESGLKDLILDINSYIKKSKGTVAFSIIQNKTERRISMLYEIATSKLSFPTQIGLMGTFFGVFVGLSEFLIGTRWGDGITDSSIQSLICGVLVSMITSFCGIYMLIKSHSKASDASNQIDRDKNEFYEWVQNELMPSVDVSMVEAIGKLHETIGQFEPTFSRVIVGFKDAFKNVTGAFGNEFRQSVQVVASAVDTMGQNMNKVNKNIELQGELLATIKSNQLIRGMDAFVEASKRFGEITGSLDQFERARRLMLIAAQETINLQKDFNESLQVPKQVAAEINSILDRITKFEANINGLGETIAQTKLITYKEVKQIEENISAIKKKQKVAEDYADRANEKLEVYFEAQKKEMGRVMQKYNEALDSYLNDYEKMLQERKVELEQRKREFVEAIDKKLSVDEIRSEFSSLKKLNDISQKLEQLMCNPVDGNQLMRTLSKIHTELNAISAIQEDNKKGSWFGNNSNTAVDRAQREKEEANRKAEEAEREKQKIIELARIQAEKDRAEKEALLAKIREEQERDQKAMEVIQRVQQKDSPVYESVNNESISHTQIDTSLEEHSSANVAEEVPTTSPTSMDKDMVEEEKTNKKGWFKIKKLFVWK